MSLGTSSDGSFVFDMASRVPPTDVTTQDITLYVEVHQLNYQQATDHKLTATFFIREFECVLESIKQQTVEAMVATDTPAGTVGEVTVQFPIIPNAAGFFWHFDYNFPRCEERTSYEVTITDPEGTTETFLMDP